jgi:chaperone BCS1
MGNFNDYMVESYSNRFNAIWFYIIENIKDNNSIHQMREMTNVKQPNGKKTDIFIVSQTDRFIIDESLQIYGYNTIDSETSKDEKSTSNIRVKSEKIEITLYSYISSLNKIEMFIDNITNTYLESIKDLRKNQLFYYIQNDITVEDKSVYNCFKEIRFESSRTFDNLFFPEKREIMDKIDFFLNNREWYEKMGIPYTLGVGIHGPPGTGKTSFFKALANYTGRHIVSLSFKLITKKKQLQDFYFETRYNYNNQDNDIGFNKKIIIFEDLDCAGDIFLDRNIKKTRLEERKIQEINATQLLSNIAQSLEKPEQGPLQKFNEDPITLDDILNLWDGLHETPGRIIAISSNHYDTLDPALIRPGRIDITMEMKLVNRETFREMFRHFFGFDITKEDLSQFRENTYSPAEMVNMYISSKKDPALFMSSIVLSKNSV